MEKQDDSSFGPQKSFNLIYGLASIYATCALPFLRTGFGSHAFGLNAGFALILMFMAGGLLNAPVMLKFIAAWLIALVLQRIVGAWSRRRHGNHIHSQYLGDPWLARIPGISDQAARGVLEPIVTFLAGIGLGAISPPLAGFLVGAAFSLFLANIIHVEVNRARVRRMRDAHIEQVYISRRFRNGE